MDDAIIKVENLTKRFGKKVAVDGISFEVKQGEIFGILGPNGAGKTTTLEMLETLQKPDSGTILLDGLDVLRQPWSVRRRIGVQLQFSGFLPNLKLTELLGLFSSLYDVRVDVMQLLELVQLQDKKDSYYERLSGGQKQRFSIATTLVQRPRVIFLDEPSTGMDPQARLNLWNIIRRIRGEGTTVVLTTHYMDEAEQLCDRLAIMESGKIARTAPPGQMIDELLRTGFRREVQVRPATLEDVFLNLTGKKLKE